MSIQATPPRPDSVEIENLSALVVRLARALKKAQPGHPLPAQAIAYLQREGLAGSPLRAEDAPRADRSPVA